VRLAGFDIDLGGDVEAAIMARGRHGRTWIAGNAAQAADLLDRLGHQAMPSGGKGVVVASGYAGHSLPPPDVEYDEGDLAESLGITLDAAAEGKAKLAGDARVAWSRLAGARIDHRTGHRTFYATASWTAAGEAKAFGGTLWSPGDAGGGELYEVEADATGRPLDLRVITTGPYRTGQDLPAVLSSEQGLIDVPAGHGDRAYTVTAHLDLTDPESLAATRGLVAALSHAGARLGSPASAAAALRRRIERSGTIEARIVERDGRRSGAALAGGVGPLRGGVDFQHERGATRLLAAVSRGLDGQWLPRDDCVARPLA
jgi:hypothetical protein